MSVWFISPRRATCAAVIAALAAGAAGCGSSSTNNSSATGSNAAAHPTGGKTLTAGVLHAFTGQNAFFGLNAQVSCKAAASTINAAGGIMGDKLACQDFDTKGDPADAVPVTNRMISSASNLTMVVGPDGNDIPSILPLLEQAKIPEMNTVGDPRYDKQTSPYFWRLTPSDSTLGPALAYYAAKQHVLSGAEVWTSDLSAATTSTPFNARYSSLGGHVLKTVTMAPDGPSYQTQVSQLLGAHPPAMIGEMDGQTSATFLKELQQQNGHLIPFVTTGLALQGDWMPAVGPAVGGANVAKYVTAVYWLGSSKGEANAQYQAALKAAGANSFQKNVAVVAATYDGVISFALAMDAAKSTSPSVYVKDIPKVTSASPGATVVHTYAQGVAALKAGKTIQYVGAGGPMLFDKYNTAARPYAVYKFNPSAKAWEVQQTLPLSAENP